MMKTIKYLFFLAIGIAILSSCSSSDIPEATVSVEHAVTYSSEAQELIDFQTELENLNKQTFTGCPQTRGFRDLFKKFVAIVTCDALGAAVGLIGGAPGVATAAITASIAAVITPVEEIGVFTRSGWTNTTIGMNEAGFSLARSIIPAVPSNGRFYTIEDSIGYYHNKVILSLNSDIYSNTVNLDSLIVKVADETYQSYKTTHTAIVNNLTTNRTSFEKITTHIMPNIHQDKSISDMIERFQQQYPDHVELLNVLKTFLNGLSNIEPTDNDGEYLNEALALLNRSLMKPETKQNIRNALIVANASYQLWKSSED